VVLFAMVAGYLPYEDADTARLYDKILRADYRMPRWVSPALRDLLGRIFVTDPARRISIPEIRRHPWFCQVAAPPSPLKTVIDGPGDISARVVREMLALGVPVDGPALQEGLLRNAHNGLTAAYYLVAERMLKRGELASASAGALAAPTLVPALAAAVGLPGAPAGTPTASARSHATASSGAGAGAAAAQAPSAHAQASPRGAVPAMSSGAIRDAVAAASRAGDVVLSARSGGSAVSAVSSTSNASPSLFVSDGSIAASSSARSSHSGGSSLREEVRGPPASGAAAMPEERPAQPPLLGAMEPDAAQVAAAKEREGRVSAALRGLGGGRTVVSDGSRGHPVAAGTAGLAPTPAPAGSPQRRAAPAVARAAKDDGDAIRPAEAASSPVGGRTVAVAGASAASRGRPTTAGRSRPPSAHITRPAGGNPDESAAAGVPKAQEVVAAARLSTPPSATAPATRVHPPGQPRPTAPASSSSSSKGDAEVRVASVAAPAGPQPRVASSVQAAAPSFPSSPHGMAGAAARPAGTGAAAGSQHGRSASMGPVPHTAAGVRRTVPTDAFAVSPAAGVPAITGHTAEAVRVQATPQARVDAAAVSPSASAQESAVAGAPPRHGRSKSVGVTAGAGDGSPPAAAAEGLPAPAGLDVHAPHKPLAAPPPSPADHLLQAPGMPPVGEGQHDPAAAARRHSC